MKHIRDTLAETAEKTFFGNLTGTAGLWDKVLRAYEKDSKGILVHCHIRNVLTGLEAVWLWPAFLLRALSFQPA